MRGVSIEDRLRDQKALSEEFDPWSLPRPENESFMKEFGPVKCHLRKLDPIQMAEALQEAARLSSEYIGDDDGLNPDGDTVEGFLGPDGEFYELNDPIIRDICFIRAMEQEHKRRSFTWWVGVCTRLPEVYQDVSAFCARMQRRGAAPGNSSKEMSPTTASSTPPSVKDNGIPSLMSDRITSSEESTTVSAH